MVCITSFLGRCQMKCLFMSHLGGRNLPFPFREICVLRDRFIAVD